MWRCAYRIYPELLLRLPPGSLNVGYRKQSEAVKKNAVWHTHTLTTPSELDRLKRSPNNVRPLRLPFWYREETESLAYCRTVNHCSYVPHRERISNSSSSESKNRSNRSESEKSAKWVSTHKKGKKMLKCINFTEFLECIWQKTCSLITRCKVKGIDADHVRGLTVY